MQMWKQTQMLLQKTCSSSQMMMMTSQLHKIRILQRNKKLSNPLLKMIRFQLKLQNHQSLPKLMINLQVLLKASNLQLSHRWWQVWCHLEWCRVHLWWQLDKCLKIWPLSSKSCIINSWCTCSSSISSTCGFRICRWWWLIMQLKEALVRCPSKCRCHQTWCNFLTWTRWICSLRDSQAPILKTRVIRAEETNSDQPGSLLCNYQLVQAKQQLAQK